MQRADASYDDVAFGWRLVDAIVLARRRLSLRSLRPAFPYLLILPSVVLVALLALGVFDLFWRSVHDFDPFRREQGEVSLSQFERLLTGRDGTYYRGILSRTLVASLVVTAGSLMLGLIVSYFLVRTSRRGSRLVALSVVLVPFLMGEIVRAFGWLLLLGRRGTLAWVTSPIADGGVSLVGTQLGIWIGMMQTMIPIAVLVMLPTVRQIDPDLERAAMTLGAKPRDVWSRIVLPLARPGLAAAGVVVFSLSMTEFAIPQVVGLGRQPFVANTIHSIYFLQNNTYFGSALAMVLVLIVTLGVIAIGALGRRDAVNPPSDDATRRAWRG
jgi:putative spermidine/putrescine transport system permease protein